MWCTGMVFGREGSRGKPLMSLKDIVESDVSLLLCKVRSQSPMGSLSWIDRQFRTALINRRSGAELADYSPADVIGSAPRPQSHRLVQAEPLRRRTPAQLGQSGAGETQLRGQTRTCLRTRSSGAKPAVRPADRGGGDGRVHRKRPQVRRVPPVATGSPRVDATEHCSGVARYEVNSLIAGPVAQV